MSAPTVIVVGAGAGGITTAARLAKQGLKVTVLERLDFIGGRCSLIERNGYRFDQGPFHLNMPEIFHQTFDDLGSSLKEEGIHLLKCEPNYRVWFADNDRVELSTNLDKMGREIERYEGKKGFQNFLSFLKESGRHYDLAVTHFVEQDFPSILSMFRPKMLASIFALHPFESTYSRVCRYFSSEKLRQAFSFATLYLGISPFEALGTYSLLQYTELAHGNLYPRGGFQKVLDALASIGRRLGVEFRLGTAVESILVSKRRGAHGVRLQSGEELFADIVVVNADLIYAYNNLLPPSSLARRLSKRETSCSCIMFCWSFDKIIPELEGDEVFLSDEYSDNFDDILKRHMLPEKPSFYLNVPSRIDPSSAPAGKDAVKVIVPLGHLTEDSTDEDEIVNFAREFVFSTIESRTGARNLRESLLHESLETPSTWQSKFNLDRGAFTGLSHSFFNSLSFRPKIKHSHIKGLYFVGASTHPGTGVPLCLSGSKIVSQQIIRDWNKKQYSMGKRISEIFWWIFPLWLFRSYCGCFLSGSSVHGDCQTNSFIHRA